MGNPNIKGLNETGSGIKILKEKEVHLYEGLTFHLNLTDELDQSTIKAKTQNYGTFCSAPEIYGGFQYYYSVQFILPDIRAGQSFGIQLKI